MSLRDAAGKVRRRRLCRDGRIGFVASLPASDRDAGMVPEGLWSQVAPRWQDGPVPEEWVEFSRSDASAVVAMVREVAGSGDPGEYGFGVEVVIETPAPGWLSGLLGDHRRDSARIAVTGPGGQVGYPFHVQLLTDQGADAAHQVPRLPGWACSRSAGAAFLMQKGGPGARYDFGGLVGGTVAALTALSEQSGERGWRAGVDRRVQRR